MSIKHSRQYLHLIHFKCHCYHLFNSLTRSQSCSATLELTLGLIRVFVTQQEYREHLHKL